MKSVNIPTTFDVFVISFLVKHGWEYDRYSDVWEKDGEKWEMSTWDKEENDRYGLNIDESKFTTEKAYDHQVQKNERDKNA